MGLLRRRLSSQRRASYNNNNNNNIRNGGNDGYGIGRDRRNYNNNNNNMGRRHNNHVDIFTKLTVILCMYLIWASYTLSTKPNLRLQLKNKFQSLLLKGEQNIYNFLGGGFPLSKKKKLIDGDSSDSSDSSSSSSSLQRQPRLRIPCGLIIAAAADNDKNNEKVVDDNTDKDKEIVLPLTTCIELLSNDDNNNDNNDDNNNNDSGISFLNENIFQRYPQFKKYTTNSKDNNVIPSGIFHLRMGSIDATIDTSPELHIIKNTSTSTSTSTSSNDNNNNNNDNDNIDIDNIDDDCDLILGKQFWDNHFTEFNDDELYLLTTSITSASSSSTSSKTSPPPLRRRVMVPYIRIRQPIFLFDDNDIGNDNSDL